METDKGVFDVSEQKPKFHPWFHKFVVWFALWAYAAFAVIGGIREIVSANENGASNYTGILIFAVLLILAGLFAVVVRFDLAAFRARAPKEMLILCLATAVILVALHFLLDIDGGDDQFKRIETGAIVAIWGFGVFQYYNQRKYLFEG